MPGLPGHKSVKCLGCLLYTSDAADEEGAGCWADDIALSSSTSTPGGCKVKEFYTVDLSGAYKIGQNTEIFGSVQNVFDKKPPFDPETYGAIGYNPLDYSGAIGRFFRVGLKHKF